MTEDRRCYTRALLADGDVPADGPLEFIASSTGTNRYGYALRNEGWRLTNYAKNPVVLWMHMDWLAPIGRGAAARRDGELVERVEFDMDDAFAAQVDRKYRARFLNAVSVGFHFVDRAGKPLANWWNMGLEEIHNDAFYDLTELSAVPVPADPRAVRRQRFAFAMDTLGFTDPDEFWESMPGGRDGWPRDILAPLSPLAPTGPPGQHDHGSNLPAAPALPGNTSSEAELRRMAAQLERVYANLAVIRPHDTDVVEAAWDEAAAFPEVVDPDADALTAMFAWRDPDGDPDDPTAYQFAHHAEPGGPASLAGCRQALEALDATDLSTPEKAGVRRHLQRHIDHAPSANDLTPEAALGFLDGIRL